MICSSLVTRFRFCPVVSTLTQVHRSEVNMLSVITTHSRILHYASYFTRLQIYLQVNLQPTSDVLERKFADPKRGEFSIRNVLPRLVFRSLSIAIATTLAAMFPFFGDIDAVIGAFGCIPLDIILLMVLYNVTFKSSKLGLMFGINTLIATIFSALGVFGAISSIRQIVLHAKH